MTRAHDNNPPPATADRCYSGADRNGAPMSIPELVNAMAVATPVVSGEPPVVAPIGAVHSPGELREAAKRVAELCLLLNAEPPANPEISTAAKIPINPGPLEAARGKESYHEH